MVRDSLTHVAHGADAVCFFQWRQSAGGAEKYHSAMLPHAGEDSAVFRTVTELGATLRDLAAVAGTPRTPARAAIVFDWESWWAVEQDSHPTNRLRYKQEALDWYSAFLELGIRADVVPVGVAWEDYDLVVAPVLHMVPGELAERLRGYVRGGGHLVTTYFSGIVDQNDHIWLGGYPGALRDLLGIRIEEFAPLLDNERADLDNGTTGTLWTDHIEVTDPATEILARYQTGEQTGRPAVTRRRGGGTATYISTRLGPAGLVPLLAELAGHAGVRSELPPNLRGSVELAVRGRHWFLINRTNAPIDVSAVVGVHATLAPRTVLVTTQEAVPPIDHAAVPPQQQAAGGTVAEPVPVIPAAAASNHQ
jgi:beta-galactosidase